MHRFAPIDASSQTLSAQLYPDEHVIMQQDGVGLYDGKDKAPDYFDGRLYLTSHRLVFINSNRRAQSIALSLDTVEQTEYWTGFLKSSPKVTLLLSCSTLNGDAGGDRFGPVMTSAPASSASTSNSLASTSKTMFVTPEEANNALAAQRTWVCRVCGMRNTPSAQLGAKCSLCGVSKDKGGSSLSSGAASSSNPASLVASRSSTPQIDRNPYGRTATPPPLPPPPQPSSLKLDEPSIADVDPTDSRVPCPACTFLNHHSMSTCEVCDTPLHSSKRISEAKGLASRSSTPGVEHAASRTSSSTSLPVFVRLSFRKGGERAFYAALKEALSKKAWDIDRPPTQKQSAKVGSSTASAGIDAIMKGFDLNARDRDDSMDEALKDLDALMSKAKEMISLAKTMNERLSSAQVSSHSAFASESAEAKAASSLASTSLARIGLVDAPVTADMVSDQTAYNHELAKELGAILCRKDAGLVNKGVMGLDEVWCLWNRARGVALVPPSSLRSCAPYLPLYTSPRISMQTFKSGLTILHTPKYSIPAFSDRLLDALDVKVALSLSWTDALQSDNLIDGISDDTVETRIERQGMTLLEIARNELETTLDSRLVSTSTGVSFNLIKEMTEQVELVKGLVCRDEQFGQGVRWFRNHLTNPDWQLEWDGTK
ncbi:Vacuolar protein-sorting-associated protein 36 [Microbotryomycetes sp. JL201]|nr:Vacuolar protein-sorting-associated protein 36 [Microbotryomycetes sp. JL201]